MATLDSSGVSTTFTGSGNVVYGSTSSATISDRAIVKLERTANPGSGTVQQQCGSIEGYVYVPSNSAVTRVCNISLEAQTTSSAGGGQLNIYGYLGSGNINSRIFMGSSGSTRIYFDSTNYNFSSNTSSTGPGNQDNVYSSGSGSFRWSVVYAATGTINTSDANFKEQIADLDAAEKRVATAIKGLIKKFKWKDAVEKKGEAARIHVGVIAQEVEAAFVAEGLDPERYGLFCKDVWWECEVPEEIELANGEKTTVMVPERMPHEVEGGVRKERKGIRYDQLLAFVIAAL